MKCKYCERDIPDNSKFCPECGSRQSDPACINCGAPLYPGAKFCPTCGRPTSPASASSRSTNWTWGDGTPERHPDPEVPDYDVFDPTKPASAKFNSVCPTCGRSDIRYQTVAESNPIGCFAWTVILIGALFVNILVFIALLLLLLIVRKSTKATTYATCQYCGERWKV